MPPSRIAIDLMAGGMGPSVHLTIVQASLCTLRRATIDLSAMRKDLDELLDTLQQGCDGQSLKKYRTLVKDINSMEKQVRHAPRIMAEFEADIEILTSLMRQLDDVKHNGHQKNSSTQDGRSMGEDGGEQRSSSV
ncbi:MAG: hypothetical protein Q9226_006770 [Calogaya cf. arnoldii]